MKFQRFPIISGAVLAGFALGLILAPSLRPAGPADASPSPGKSAAATPQGAATSAATAAPAGSPSRTRVRDREQPAAKPAEPRMAVPVKTVVKLLQAHFRGVGYQELPVGMERAVDTLGISRTESDEINDLFKKSRDELTAAEKTCFKLGHVTPDRIEIDTSAIREPASAIIGRLQQGIRSTLKPEAAELLISSIDWKKYYPIDNSSTTTFEISRKYTGLRSAWVRTTGQNSGRGIDKRKFPDDGTPLPADQIFDDRWKPYLQGLTLLPTDEE